MAILCLVAKSRAKSGCSSHVLHHTKPELRRPKEGLHNPGSGLCLRFLRRLHDHAHGRFLVEGFAMAGHHGQVEVDLRVRPHHLFSLVHASVTRACSDMGLVSNEQIAGVETEEWCWRRASCPRPHRARRIRDTSACRTALLKPLGPRLSQCWRQWVRSMVATANGGRLPVAEGNQGDHFGPRHQ